MTIRKQAGRGAVVGLPTTDPRTAIAPRTTVGTKPKSAVRRESGKDQKKVLDSDNC